MLRRVTIIQTEAGRQLSREENLLIFRQRPDFIIFPEYYNVDPSRRDTIYNAGRTPEFLRYIQTLSDRFGTAIVAGTALEWDDGHFYNTAYLYNRGELIGKYHKTCPTQNEIKHGVTPGNGVSLFEVDGVRLSILICADVLQPHSFSQLRPLNPDIIFVPTTSPLKPGETIGEKFARDKNIFVAGAQVAGGFVVKCCAVGTLWDGSLQGRSLVAAPWGILTRIQPLDEDRRRILSITLDIAELRDFRTKWVQHSPFKT